MKQGVIEMGKHFNERSRTLRASTYKSKISKKGMSVPRGEGAARARDRCQVVVVAVTHDSADAGTPESELGKLIQPKFNFKYLSCSKFY